MPPEKAFSNGGHGPLVLQWPLEPLAKFSVSQLYGTFDFLACEQALGGMGGERKEEGRYTHLKFYCSAPFLTFL